MAYSAAKRVESSSIGVAPPQGDQGVDIEDQGDAAVAGMVAAAMPSTWR